MTTQAQSVSFTLDQSNKPFQLQNGLLASTATVNYVITGAPATMAITVESLANQAGADQNLEMSSNLGVLDTYSSTSNISGRSVTLTGTPTWLQFTANWTGGSDVMVTVTVTSSGAGPTYSNSTAPLVQTVAQAAGPG
jgi:hypothetical protein